jgi:hypothetical protein
MKVASAAVETIAQTLRVFWAPGQVGEVRALGVGAARALSRTFTDPNEAALWAAEQDQLGARGVYFTPNPLRPDMIGSKASARKADVMSRRWLLIDVDPVRPPDTPATDAERASAWAVMDAVRGSLEGVGMVDFVLGDSGNGWHLSVPIDLPNDDASTELVKSVVRGLAQRCNSPAAQVDTKTFDLPRIWKLYGTVNRKGAASAERPHRIAKLLGAPACDQVGARANTAKLTRLLEMWKWIDDARRNRPGGDLISRAKAYIAKEPPAVSGQHGHDRCFHVACVLVKDFGLDVESALQAIQDWNQTCQPPWSEQELRHKLGDALKREGPIGRLVNGSAQPESNGRMNADNSSDPLDGDATAADLIAANVTMRFAWNRWLPNGVLTVLASEPGVGKTRFCADLARRVHLGLPWPDGQPPTFERGSRTLWVPADNQHAELGSLPAAFGFPPETLYLNATRRNPFAGTLLDDPEDLREFEARIRRVRPALVFVDTSLNATDRTAHRPEDAKAFFVPLQQIVSRWGGIMVCVTHLNAAGKPLGRRIMGQARLVMQLECPDPDKQPNRRKLYVVKSNSLYPPPLGVTMGDSGNEYDDQPPEPPATAPSRKAEKVQACKTWLEAALDVGPKRVNELRTAAEEVGFSAGTLYQSKDELEVEQFEAQGRKWWRLPAD